MFCPKGRQQQQWDNVTACLANKPKDAVSLRCQLEAYVCAGGRGIIHVLWDLNRFKYTLTIWGLFDFKVKTCLGLISQWYVLWNHQNMSVCIDQYVKGRERWLKKYEVQAEHKTLEDLKGAVFSLHVLQMHRLNVKYVYIFLWEWKSLGL